MNRLSFPKMILWVSSLIALIIGLVITAVLWRYSTQQQSAHLKQEFKFASEQIANNIDSRIASYEIVMRGVRGYIQGSNEVTYDEFKHYVQDLQLDKKKSGVQGVGLVQLVSEVNKERHIIEHRSLAYADYDIRPSGIRDQYAPIIRMEPMDADNIKVIGFDVMTVPAARLAMEQARDFNSITITQPITLVQDAGKYETYAFVMYLPIYAKHAVLDDVATRRNAITGWVDVPFRINDLMAGLQGELPKDIVLEIYDGPRVQQSSRMYRSYYQQADAKYPTTQRLTKQLNVGSRTWTILTKSTPAFEARVSRPHQPLFIAVTGIYLSLVLASLIWLLTHSRQKAETRYQQLFSKAADAVIILNAAHRVIDCNQAAIDMFGYEKEALQTLYLSELLAKIESGRLSAFFHTIRSGHSELSQWEYINKSGQSFTAEVSASPLDEHYSFVILRDLTERKKAEQRIQRLNRLYLALSETNQAIVRMDNENELFQLVCKCAVDLGEMKIAWIGQIDESSSIIYPSAIYAAETKFLRKLEEVNEAAGHFHYAGPSMQAIQTNSHVIINQIVEGTANSVLGEEAKQMGWQSVGSFPIPRNGQPYAVLTVYHDSINAFDEEAIDLLVEMAGDISFALDNFDREERRVASEKMLRESEQKLSIILDNVGAHIYLKDKYGRYLFVNQPVLDGWGTTLDEVVGQGDASFFDAETAEKIVQNDRRVLENGEILELEEVARVEKTGETNIYWSIKIPLLDAAGEVDGLCGISTNITQQRMAESDLRIAAIAFESQEGLMVTDAHKMTLRVNQAYIKISGYAADEVVGQCPLLLSHDHHDQAFSDRVWSAVAQQGGWEGEVWNRRKNGEVYPQHLIITAVLDARGEVANYVISLTDITETKAAAMEIEHLAFFDTLTQLPNRRLLLDRLSHALTASRRSSLFGGLLYLDLDHFKVINDSRGHDVGDVLLKQVSERLKACVGYDDTVARLGGDEYVIMLEGLSKDPVDAAAKTELIAQKIQYSLNQTYVLANHQFNISASIGLVLFGGLEQSQEELLKQADIAMYHAKKSGRNAYRFFDPHMQSTINTRVQLEEELRNALVQHQFRLYYQVQVDAQARLIGAEALIRWQHPERGLIPPFDFIPLAEETGLILPIGRWVLNQACAQLKLWEANESTKHLSISINVSAKQFHQVDFVQEVTSAVALHNIRPTLLKIELTESMLVDNIESTIVSMNAIRKLGVCFELDDFGTGYSSLQYLKRLPLHQLKIDQSFVRDIHTDKSDKAIVRTIIKMAQGLGLEVIAEGVEIYEQLQHLKKIGCPYYQGYLFGKPLPIDQFEAEFVIHQPPTLPSKD